MLENHTHENMMYAIPKAGPEALADLTAYLDPFADLFRRH